MDQKTELSGLGPREREVMEALYARRNATVAEILDELRDPPSYSAVRAILAKLERKGFARAEVDGRRYVYAPVLSRQSAYAGLMGRVMNAFFGGSAARMVTALIDAKAGTMSDAELAALEKLIVRKRGKE